MRLTPSLRQGRDGRWSMSDAAALAMVALLGACQRDYRFHTVAVYEAPRGQLSIRIEGKGVVRAGHDISQEATGVLRVSPSRASGPAAPSPVVLDLELRGSHVQFGDPWLGDTPSSNEGAMVLSRKLSEGGYLVPAEELDELISATQGVLVGPKGTLMSGQTRVLRVVSTSFDQ